MFKSVVIRTRKQKRLICAMAADGWSLFSINNWEWTRNTVIITFVKSL